MLMICERCCLIKKNPENSDHGFAAKSGLSFSIVLGGFKQHAEYQTKAVKCIC